MTTLAQLKRDANTGKMFLLLFWRYGKTGDELPDRLRGRRTVIRANSVGLVIRTGTEDSMLYIENAKLIDYDGSILTVYKPAYRTPTDQERLVLNTWGSMETEYLRKNPFGDPFWKRKAYFAKSTCPWMDGITKVRGKRYLPEKDKVMDYSLRGEVAMRYEVFLDD